MNDNAPPIYTFKLNDGRQFNSLFPPRYIEEVGICYVFFNWVAGMDVVFGPKAQAEHSPAVFEVLKRLADKGYVEEVKPYHWRSKREAMILARSYDALSDEQKEWITERVTQDDG